jgi:hypothetical protein
MPKKKEMSRDQMEHSARKAFNKEFNSSQKEKRPLSASAEMYRKSHKGQI